MTTESLPGIEFSRRIVKIHMRSLSELKKMLNHLSCGIGVYEVREGKVYQIYLNDSVYTMLGDTRENRSKYSGFGFINAVHPEDQKALSEMLHKIVLGEKKVQLTYRVINYNGNYIWFHLCGTTERDSDGKIVCYCSFSDIDEQMSAWKPDVGKKADTSTVAAKNGHALDKQLMDINMTDAPNLLAKGRYNLSKNTLEYFIRNHEDGINQMSTISYDEGLMATAELSVSDEKRKEILEILERRTLIQEFHAGNTQFTIEYQRKGISKPAIWVLLQCKTYLEPYSGDIMCFIYSFDISDQKISDALIHTVVDLEFDYLALLDCKTKACTLYAKNQESGAPMPSYYTSGYEQEMEKFTREFFVGEDIDDYLHEVSITNLQKKLTENEVFVTLCTIRTQGGKFRRKKLKFSYLDEAMEQILITRMDITDVYEKEQKQMKQLQSAMASVEKANNVKEEFLSRMSHDLRTPMNAIIGLTALAKDEILNPEAMDSYLDKINSAGKFLLGLVNDCLDIEKIVSDRMELHPQAYSFEEFRNSIITMIQPLCRQKEITFVYDDSQLKYNIFVDKIRFEQIFFNLLSNAVKFTPEGGKVELCITIKGYKRNVLDCDFTVRDNGIGISEEFQKHMFEPFEQERNEKTAGIEGTGLGLSIVKNLIELMKGTLSVKSEEGKGTEFAVCFSLPVLEEAENTEKLSQESSTVNCLEKKRILLVEDHPLNIEIAKKLLEKKGMCVTCASNGLEGLDCFRNSDINYYDAILMDVRMPVMTGMETTREIRGLQREDARNIPIIAMTANVFSEDIKETKQAGMNAHLSKPIEPQKLYQTLEKFIGCGV